MSQRQKEQQAADGQPPAGPNGELQFQPQTQKPNDKGKQRECATNYAFCFVIDQVNIPLSFHRSESPG